MLDTTSGEVVKTTLQHEGNKVREFYSSLARPVRVGIECLVGHPAEIRAAEPRKQKHDRRDADLLLSLLVEERFPTIWLPTKERLDLRALLRHRQQWVCLRVKIQNALQAMALAFDEALLCGRQQANRRSRRCRCRRMPPSGRMSCRHCM